MEQLVTGSSSAPGTPTMPATSSASTGNLGSSGGLASTADSSTHGGGVAAETPTVLPPRRRLVKTAARTQSETKREGVGGPPGFGQAPLNSSSSLPSSVVSALPSSTGIAGVGASLSLPGGFRERDRVPLRSSGKDLLGDQAHGISGSSKPGRPPHVIAGALEARHLGRRPEVNLRRHEAGAAQKRNSLLRAQNSGAPGNFKAFDSSHNNYLVPVIPLQFAAKQ